MQVNFWLFVILQDNSLELTLPEGEVEQDPRFVFAKNLSTRASHFRHRCSPTWRRMRASTAATKLDGDLSCFMDETHLRMVVLRKSRSSGPRVVDTSLSIMHNLRRPSASELERAIDADPIVTFASRSRGHSGSWACERGIFSLLISGGTWKSQKIVDQDDEGRPKTRVRIACYDTLFSGSLRCDYIRLPN